LFCVRPGDPILRRAGPPYTVRSDFLDVSALGGG